MNQNRQNSDKPNEQQLVRVVRDLVESQKHTHQLQQQELELEREKIRSNEKIALASIEAQKGDRTAQMTLFSKIHRTQYILFGVIAVLVVVVLVVAMSTNNTALASEIVKIGGAVLLGYLAGVNKGKASVLEKQKQEDE